MPKIDYDFCSLLPDTDLSSVDSFSYLLHESTVRVGSNMAERKLIQAHGVQDSALYSIGCSYTYVHIIATWSSHCNSLQKISGACTLECRHCAQCAMPTLSARRTCASLLYVSRIHIYLLANNIGTGYLSIPIHNIGTCTYM